MLNSFVFVTLSLLDFLVLHIAKYSIEFFYEILTKCNVFFGMKTLETLSFFIEIKPFHVKPNSHEKVSEYELSLGW